MKKKIMKNKNKVFNSLNFYLIFINNYKLNIYIIFNLMI